MFPFKLKNEISRIRAARAHLFLGNVGRIGSEVQAYSLTYHRSVLSNAVRRWAYSLDSSVRRVSKQGAVLARDHWWERASPPYH